MFVVGIALSLVVMARAGPATEMAAYKGQFCTDPRTMRKHAAYTEWADAYSCTRHRCQPGGRNLAIYTVGCKRVEAPESAIECEEVVEDTNMQFPYCCTRLRCLVVVRGEVWTRVLGQPWETLPAAPWSHMYKMKKPPPSDGTFTPKTEEGPVYELQVADNEREAPPTDAQVLRTGKKLDTPECNDAVARAAPAPAPDIVIALSTGSDKETSRKKEEPRHKRRGTPSNSFFEEGDLAEPRNEEIDDTVTEKEKIAEPQSEERSYGNYYVPEKQVKSAPHHMVSWTEIPQNQWNEHDTVADNDQPQSNVAPNQRSQWNDRNEHEPEALRMAPDVQARTSPSAQTWEHQSNAQPEYNAPPEEKKEEKPGNLQALVDAIGTRMRDIETVVARMSEKVHQDRKQIDPELGNTDQNQQQFRSNDDQKYHEGNDKDHGKMKKSNPDDHYKSHGSKYLRASGGDVTTEQPLFVEDTNLNGYFSDASNSLITRRNGPKEPAATYMAPVAENRRKAHSDSSDESEKKHKKRIHKKKRAKGHHKKHHGKDDKRRKFRLNSVEQDRNAVSLEDSSAVVSKETDQKNSQGQNKTTDPFSEYVNPFEHQKEYVLKTR